MEQVDRVIDALSQRYFGKYRGEVSDTADPTKRARLKVKCPAVLGDQEVWAMPAVPYAGKSIGLLTQPPAQPQRLDRWTASARHKRNHQKNDRDHQQHVSDPTRLTRNPAEAQKFRDEGDHQKNDGIP